MLTAAVIALSAVLCGCGGGGESSPPPPPPVQPPAPPLPPVMPPPPPGQVGTGPEDCIDGSAGEYPCMGISLESRVALDSMEGTQGNDLWGWADAQTGKEYALMGLNNGTAFVDISNPQSPIFLGRLPTETRNSAWRDIKVYRDHAYIVADNAGDHGMQVFDLRRLRGMSGPSTWSTDALYDGFGHSHNLAINEATGFLYAASTDDCGGGLHIIDIRTPNNPLFAGCHDTVRTHDTQCVTYQGPDEEHRDREICFSSNENHLEVVDVNDKSAPMTLSSSTYPNRAYVHQGWLTQDHRYFLLGDELDESNFSLTTRTHVFDVSDLDAPTHLFAHDLGSSATDHNLYVQGNRVFEANYQSGLRVLELRDVANRDIVEIAFFDTYPNGDGNGFRGAWSVYPYLPSGTLIVSDIQSGLFLLSMD